WSWRARSACRCSWAVLRSRADVGGVKREELEPVIDRERVVQGPAVGGARRQYLVERKRHRAGGAFDVGKARIEHLANAGEGELLGHLARRRDALDEDEQLVAGTVAQRLEIAHDAVAAVDLVVQLVAAVAE